MGFPLILGPAKIFNTQTSSHLTSSNLPVIFQVFLGGMAPAAGFHLGFCSGMLQFSVLPVAHGYRANHCNHNSLRCFFFFQLTELSLW